MPMDTSFSDEELAFLRHARFGELPGRVLPEDYTEAAETEPQSEALEAKPWEGFNPGYGA